MTDAPIGREPATVVAELAETIATSGSGRVFAFPGGGTNLDVIEQLALRDVDVVVARSEVGAAFMAATHGELTGRPGVLLVGLGPGVASAVNGVAHARLDQCPLVVVSDRYATSELATTGHQLLDHLALLAPVTKWQETLNAGNAAAAVRRAFAEAVSAPCGPVHLELPRDVVGLPLGVEPPAAAQPPGAGDGAAFLNTTLGSQDRDMGSEATAAADLRAGVAALTSALRPLVLVGDEAADVPAAQLIELAEALVAPVLTSYKAKGVFPEDHGLWSGIITNAAIEADLLAAADCIVAIGLDPIELLPKPWSVRAPLLALRAHAEPAPGYRPRWSLTGDVAALVKMLGAQLRDSEPSTPRSQWTRTHVAERLARLRASLRLQPPGSLGAVEIVEAVQSAVPPDTTVAVDSGAHMFASTWFWRSTKARHFLISNGLASMGYAVPAAVGAALARPGTAVVALTGDGGFVLHAAELETALRVGARIIVVVFNDASLSMIRIKQEDRAFRAAAVDFRRTPVAQVATGFGAIAESAADAAALQAAVGAALESNTSTVIEVPIAGSEYRGLQRVIRG